MTTDKELKNQVNFESIRIKCPRCLEMHAMELWTETDDHYIWTCEFCGWEYHEPRISFVHGEE